MIVPKPFARMLYHWRTIYLDDYDKSQLEIARQQLEEALNAQADAIDQLVCEDH